MGGMLQMHIVALPAEKLAVFRALDIRCAFALS